MQDIFEFKDSLKAVEAVTSINVYGKDKVGKEKPMFTIAIPTYKRVSTLSETIESTLKQENFDDYNVIVVDNNPERNDETEIFMRKYIDHPKVTYYKNSDNVGMAGNWNKCALLSDADQYILLHDDDILSPYALSSFQKIRSSINGRWGLVKPILVRFSNAKELHFEKPDSCILCKHHDFNYFAGDAISAPSAVLINRESYIRSSGTDMEFFPCIDYVMSFLLNRVSATYLCLCELGGYRVGINESLSETTMNNFFKARTAIARNIMDHYYVPKFLQKSLLTHSNYDTLAWVKKYYNMPEYEENFEELDLYKKNDVRVAITGTVYHFVLRLLNFFTKKRISM